MLDISSPKIVFACFGFPSPRLIYIPGSPRIVSRRKLLRPNRMSNLQLEFEQDLIVKPSTVLKARFHAAREEVIDHLK